VHHDQDGRAQPPGKAVPARSAGPLPGRAAARAAAGRAAAQGGSLHVAPQQRDLTMKRGEQQ